MSNAISGGAVAGKVAAGGLAAERWVRSGWARLLRTRIRTDTVRGSAAEPTAPVAVYPAVGDTRTLANPWRPHIVDAELRQPDSTTCGPSSLVMARLINDPGYRAPFVHSDGTVDAAGFIGEVATMRRMLSRPIDHAGRPQLPWIAALGTGPWAAARAMSGRGGAGKDGALYRVLPFDPLRADDALAVVCAAVRAGEVMPLFVGNRMMARHIVAVTGATDTDLEYYDPADGAWHTVASADLLAGRAVIAGWSEPWFAVVPAHGRHRELQRA